MGSHGLQEPLELVKLSMGSPMGKEFLCLCVRKESSSLLQMEPLGLKVPLGQLSISRESTTEKDYLWQSDGVELFLPHQMGSHGLQELLVQQTISMKPPTPNNPPSK